MSGLYDFFLLQYSNILNAITHYVFRITKEDYILAIEDEIKKVVKLQEELDIDVLVHGDPEVSLFTILHATN